MKVKITKGTAYGHIDAPPSKSMAHRLLICAGLSQGIHTVHGISESEDMLATLDCLEAMGVKCSRDGNLIRITGINPKTSMPRLILNCRESGSTLRFFIPICLLSGNEVILTGSSRLLERPQGMYKDICDKHGMTFLQDEDRITVKGPLKSGVYELPGNVSSQFISGLLFALPLVDGDSLIKITTTVESKSYIDMTIDALSTFGVKVEWQDERTIYVAGNQAYGLSNTQDVYVEGDYSNAAFFEALNILGGSVQIGNLRDDSIQGDKVYSKMFEVLQEESEADDCLISANACQSLPALDISDCPDLGPILFAVAAAKNGATFTGTKRLRIKESDRGQAMARELAKFGIKVNIHEDEIEVEPSDLHKPTEMIDGHNDHRIVMANAILLTLTGGIIEGAEAVSKSFPDFFEKLAELGIEVEKLDN